MTQIHHLNCVDIQSPHHGQVIGHCLLIETAEKLILVDTGIGILDVKMPEQRIGKQLIDLVGFTFDEQTTAFRQIEKLGLDPKKVSDCVISHLDNDHIGGLADFPQAKVHVSTEEYENFKNGNPRYLPHQLAHQPLIITYPETAHTWFGFEARKLAIDLDQAMYLIPLFGHTLGHCGVAIQQANRWLFYVGDAYYLKVELTEDNPPVNALAKLRADDDNLRVETLNKIKQCALNNPAIEIFGYHDLTEFLAFISPQ